MFASRTIFGIGASTREAVSRLRSGVRWWEAGVRSAGNGALMRIAPVVIPHLRAPSPELWVDAALLTMTTHNDPAAIASSVAFTALVWELLGADRTPPAEWWPAQILRVLTDVETGERYAARGGRYTGTEGPFSQLVAMWLEDAATHKRPVLEACEAFHSGAYLVETVPCAVYILMRCGHGPEEAIVRAVNDTVDNDTTAAIVLGALHGASALPRQWREGLTGRTAEADDGRMFEILAAARARFEAFGP